MQEELNEGKNLLSLRDINGRIGIQNEGSERLRKMKNNNGEKIIDAFPYRK